MNDDSKIWKLRTTLKSSSLKSTGSVRVLIRVSRLFQSLAPATVNDFSNMTVLGVFTNSNLLDNRTDLLRLGIEFRWIYFHARK